MLAQAWRLELDRVRKRKAEKRVGEQGSHSERWPTAGVIKLPLMGFWDSVGTKKAPQTFLREIPQPGLEERCGCESQF